MLFDLFPVIQLRLELRKFHNVDLHSRGYYHVRCKLRPSPKPGNTKIDVQVPRTIAPHVFPASVVDGQAVGKTIEILYADETIALDDAFYFTIRIAQRFDKLPPWLKFSLALELWYCEKEHMLKKSNKDLMDGFRCLSRRDLHLRLSLNHGLHYCRPVLFDYYNLAAVTLCIHASLYELTAKPASTKQIKRVSSGSKISGSHSSDAIASNSSNSQTVVISEKIRSYHQMMCKMLLSAYESLQIRTKLFLQHIPSKYQIRIQMVDTAGKLEALCHRLTNEPEPWTAIDQDRELLSQELSVLWNQFLDLFQFSDEVDRSLANEHHNARVKRFAEGFFHTEDTIHGLLATTFTNAGQSLAFYSRLVEILKRSTYFSDLPQLPVACDDLDGSSETMPVIFEDKFISSAGSRKASRLPSQSITDNGVSRSRKTFKSERLSPEKVVRALKQSLCLDLTYRNRPATEREFWNDSDEEEEKSVYVTAKEFISLRESSECQKKISTSNSSLSSPASPLYLSSFGTTLIRRSCSEPNLVQQRSRETVEAVYSAAKSEWDLRAVLFSPFSPTDGKQWSLELGKGIVSRETDGDNDERRMLDSSLPPNGYCCLPICNSNNRKKNKSVYDDADGRISSVSNEEFYSAQLTASVDDSVVDFIRWKEHFKERLSLSGYTGYLCSDFVRLASRTPYFSGSSTRSSANESNVHLMICVHGLDGCSADLRPYRTYLNLGMPRENVDFLMSEKNQNETFNDFESMTRNFVDEILVHLSRSAVQPSRISFVAHSLGTIIVRSALCDPRLEPFLAKLHCFLSLNGPHCGVLFTQKAFNWGMSFVQWWKRSRSIEQLCMRDQTPDNLRESFLYKLSTHNGLALFKYVLLVGSNQDMYVPCHSALIQPCKASQKESNQYGAVYSEMVNNLLQCLASSKRRTTLIRYTAFHGMAGMSRTHQVLGRAAHIAVLDDDLFIEKLLNVSALQYFA